MELVVLVDDANTVLGTKPKDEVHTKNTPLHRGFSLFVFNSHGQLLVTKRADVKKTFPGVWTNTVCGHPGLDEEVVAAATRRLKDELGMIATGVKIVSPYRYRFIDANGIVENEICPILVGFSDADPVINLQETSELKWVPWKEFLKDISDNPTVYSPWCREEALIIDSLGII